MQFSTTKLNDRKSFWVTILFTLVGFAGVLSGIGVVQVLGIIALLVVLARPLARIFGIEFDSNVERTESGSEGQTHPGDHELVVTRLSDDETSMVDPISDHFETMGRNLEPVFRFQDNLTRQMDSTQLNLTTTSELINETLDRYPDLAPEVKQVVSIVLPNKLLPKETTDRLNSAPGDISSEHESPARPRRTA
jgi:hypothetical protein